MRYILIVLVSIWSVSRIAENQKENILEIASLIGQNNASQIGQYVVEIYQDSKGNLWFGTLEKGVAKYDGSELIYLTTKDGLPSNRVVSVVEDRSGNLWFGTGSGLSKFDGMSFSNYSVTEGLCNNMISNLFIDSKEDFWIGTWGGVCKFDGVVFEKFIIPNPSVDTRLNMDTKDWVTIIMEDSDGSIWFGRDGYGAVKYDGSSFIHYTIKDGLNSNNVQAIAEDHEGNIWIGTRVAEKDNADASKRFGKGGLNKYNGEKFIQFPNIDGLSKNDVYTIYKDNSGNLWVSTLGDGIYKYENKEFKNYPLSKPTMNMLEDKDGRLWFGCSGGLYRLDSRDIINVTTTGPWN
ncbi:ligand-binding sensor domain-containing protein [Zhouia amylolytica]|uniref:ligand-binding sensor domain-containing protein n=1 Tax=Zhouia amylolytica TaxID=376730 RepID=UPI0020CC2D1A|nr:two-component regulator propeller domain-containing protein [Zhouia amylolytica]MCQ0112929.1 hypothetical protein [Zhouia amylolytica]